MNDLVTVVTITYNAETVLEETMLSVINQSYKNIEYIIIDGASTDGTIDIIKKYEDKIDYWVSEPDEGIYFAMNKAIEQASGQWINFMNAGDTFFDLDTVQYVIDHKEDDVELIYGDYKVKDTNQISKALDKAKWFKAMPFCHQTLFTKTTIMKEELFDTCFRLAADHNFIIKMIQKNKKFFYIDNTIAIFAPGGFAEENRLLMYVESIKVFLDHGIEKSIIEQSDWYTNFQKRSALYQEQTKVIVALQNALQNVSDIRFIYSPMKKLKAYKKLMKAYYKSKK